MLIVKIVLEYQLRRNFVADRFAFAPALVCRDEQLLGLARRQSLIIRAFVTALECRQPLRRQA